MAESKTSPRGWWSHCVTAQVLWGNYLPWHALPPGIWALQWPGVCLHVYTGMKVLQPEQRRQPKMESTWAGILPGLENMSCWAGKALGMCLLPKGSSRAGAAFPVPTDAIPSQSSGQLRHRNGNSSRPRECTAGKSIISVIYRLRL